MPDSKISSRPAGPPVSLAQPAQAANLESAPASLDRGSEASALAPLERRPAGAPGPRVALPAGASHAPGLRRQVSDPSLASGGIVRLTADEFSDHVDRVDRSRREEVGQAHDHIEILEREVSDLSVRLHEARLAIELERGDRDQEAMRAGEAEARRRQGAKERAIGREAQIADLTRDLERALARGDALLKSTSTLEDVIHGAESTMAQLQRQIGHLRSKRDEADERVARMQQSKATLRAKGKEAARAADETRTELGDQLVRASSQLATETRRREDAQLELQARVADLETKREDLWKVNQGLVDVANTNRAEAQRLSKALKGYERFVGRLAEHSGVSPEELLGMVGMTREELNDPE